MSTLELCRVSEVCGQGTQRGQAAVMRAQRTANEPTLSCAHSAIGGSVKLITAPDRLVRAGRQLAGWLVGGCSQIRSGWLGRR
jgi:hypothetical protein